VAVVNAIREFNQQIPIFALSADALRHDLESQEMSGFTGVLVKPIDIGLLHKTFAHYLPQGSAPE
jgi:CheY-like chemotaxis protein